MATSSSFSDMIVIMRGVYTQSELDEKYRKQSKPRTLRDVIKDNCHWSWHRLSRHVLAVLPIINVIRHYQFRKWILLDMLAGLSGSFIHMLMGIAFGTLAALRPVNGLYTSFFPVTVYIIFGTSPHVSLGTNAAIALLTANVVLRETEIKMAALAPNTTMTEEEIYVFKVGVSNSVCLTGGLIILGMGIFKLGFVTDYFSKPFIGGFNFSGAMHIAISQVVRILNLKVRARSSMGYIVRTFIEIFKNITQSNPADVIIGLTSIAILLAVKIGINERYRHKLKLPIPTEMLLVIVSTLISYYTDLQGHFHIAVIGAVPQGIPAPTLPPVEMYSRVALDGFVITILCFSLTISLGKHCAKINSYEIDDDQELVSYGLGHIVGSFFGTFPACIIPPRTMLVNSMGAMTILCNLPSSILVFLVLMVIGPLFETLPISMLAAMIIVNLKDVLLQVRELPAMWRKNRLECITWIITALVSILGNLDVGLLVGLCFSMFTVMVVNQMANGKLLGRSETEDLIIPAERQGVTSVPGVRIFRFETQLYFVSAERFKRQLFDLVFDPRQQSNMEMEKNVPPSTVVPLTNGSAVDVAPPSEPRNEIVHHLILDCSFITYLDFAGIDVLQMAVTQFSRAGVEVFLASVPHSALVQLTRAEFFKKFDTSKVFYSVHDALHRACGGSQHKDSEAETIDTRL